MLDGFERYRDGTRLAAVVFDGGEGAEVFDRFHDTLLGFGCGFSPDSEGTPRCFPRRQAEEAYADPGCTELALSWWGSAAIPTHVSLPTGGGCVGLHQSFRRAVAVGAPFSTAVYRRTPEGCVEAPLEPGWLAYRAEVIDDELVTGVREAHVLGGGIGLVQVRGADGSLAPLEPLDEASGERCSPGILPGRCVPGDPAYDFGRFRSGSCDGAPAAYSVGDDACGPSLFAARPGGAAPAYHRVLGPAPAPVFEQSGKTCVEADEPNRRYWEVEEAPTSVELFPRIGEVELGTGRLRVRMLATEDGTHLGLFEAWYDTEREVQCVRFPVVTGGARCLPHLVTQAGLYFSDAACTVSIALADDPTGVLAITQDDEQRVTEVHELGDPITGPMYIRLADGMCLEAFGTPGHELGDPVDIATFPAITEVGIP
jgi:hypothetical protein